MVLVNTANGVTTVTLKRPAVLFSGQLCLQRSTGEVTEGVTNPNRPQKTALLLAQRIVRYIDQNNLGPGDRLPPERVMTETYKVGRGTLRESLRFLEFQGVLSFKPGPGGGPVIEKPNGSNLAATLILLLQFDHARYQVVSEARQAFEPLMAQLAAERIQPKQLAELEQTLIDMETDIGDVDAYLYNNRRFHEIIAWASGNSLFGFLIDAMVGGLDISGATQGIEYPVRRRTAVLAAHRRIYEAIRDGNSEQARTAMGRHVAEYVTYAERKFPAALDKPIKW
jgi:GntR family transcriptional regulator, transcriptional repressor for pyruvate dehydrogenase complex